MAEEQASQGEVKVVLISSQTSSWWNHLTSRGTEASRIDWWTVSGCAVTVCPHHRLSNGLVFAPHTQTS